MIVILKAELIKHVDDRKMLTEPTEEKIEQERKDMKRAEKLFLEE